MVDAPNILVLGVGNTLFTDEGLGVRAVEQLSSQYDFSDNIALMDGGTLGMKLMEYITKYEKLIVVDAVLGDGEAGSIYRLTGDDLRKSLAFNNSMHQTDLVDTLIFCELIGNRPDTVVIGMEPSDYETMNINISPEVACKLDSMCDIVLQEITKSGGTFSKK